MDQWTFRLGKRASDPIIWNIRIFRGKLDLGDDITGLTQETDTPS